MIIIDGCDGSGKTTLTEMMLRTGLVDKILPSPRIPAKGDVERMKFETDRYLRLYGENQRIVIDRYLFSEMAYGPVLRGGSAFTRNEYLTKLLELCLSKSLVIFCMPDVLHFKVKENPQVIENQERLKLNYKALSEDSAFAITRTYIYKWDEPNAFKQLTRWIKENR